MTTKEVTFKFDGHIYYVKLFDENMVSLIILNQCTGKVYARMFKNYTWKPTHDKYVKFNICNCKDLFDYFKLCNESDNNNLSTTIGQPICRYVDDDYGMHIIMKNCIDVIFSVYWYDCNYDQVNEYEYDRNHYVMAEEIPFIYKEITHNIENVLQSPLMQEFVQIHEQPKSVEQPTPTVDITSVDKRLQAIEDYHIDQFRSETNEIIEKLKKELAESKQLLQEFICKMSSVFKE